MPPVTHAIQSVPLVHMYRYRDFWIRYPVPVTTLICVLVYLIGLVYLIVARPR